MTIPEFFDLIDNGKSYLTLLCTEETYKEIPEDLRSKLVISSIRQKNESFKDDPVHKGFVKNLRKAKKDLSDYEYNKNIR